MDLIGGVRELGARFAVIGVLPLAALALFVLALLWSGAPDTAPDLDEILEHARDMDGWEAALLVLALVLLAFIAQPFQLAAVRLLEGYGGGGRLGRALAEPGRRLQRWRLARLHQALRPAKTREAALAQVGTELQRRQLFPEREDDLLPTRLGNALRAGERRAGSAYGLDAVVVWPRLYPLLPDAVRGLVDDRRDQLDLAVRLTFVFLVAAVVSFGLLLSHGAWLLVPLGCLVGAWLSYRGAIAAAVAYGEQLRAAIDLHRFDLLRALHLPLPESREKELAANRELMLFLRQDQPADLAYTHAAG
jgi:hypothetical protein